jgi:Zn-dependent protease with chaperone function
MRSSLTLFLITIITIRFFSQDLNTNYSKFNNYKPKPEYLKNLFLGYDSIYRSISYREKKENKVMKEALNETKSNLENFDTNDLLMKNDSITRYLQNLANTIQQKNPLLTGRKITVFTYRSILPNAANYGNGIILFNLNLIAKFNKEENVAFILCHEIGHDIKGHVIEGIRKNYELEVNSELKKQFDKIRSQEFNKFKSYEAYAANYLNQLTSKKRSLEIQADSIGLFLYYNAGYNLNDAYETIQRLDSIDGETYTAKIDFNKYFNYPQQAFKKSWLEPEEEEETIDGGNIEQMKRPDSLKTHPDCKDRLRLLKNIKLNDKKSNSSNGDYSYMYYMSQLEMLDVYLADFEYSKGLYNALQLAEKYPDNLYVKCSILNYLYELYYSKEHHFFSMVSDKPDKKNTESFQELIYFLNNINSSTLKNIVYGYFKANFSTSISDAYSGYILTLLKSMDKTKEQKVVLVNEYEKSFGKNDYLLKLKSKFTNK